MTETTTLALPCEDDAVTVERVRVSPEDVARRPDLIREQILWAIGHNKTFLRLDLRGVVIGKRVADALYAGAVAAVGRGAWPRVIGVAREIAAPEASNQAVRDAALVMLTLLGRILLHLVVVVDADQFTVLTSSGSPWPCTFEVEP